jgi:hypothetical protein
MTNVLHTDLRSRGARPIGGCRAIDGSTLMLTHVQCMLGAFSSRQRFGHQGLNRDAIVDLKVASHKNCVGAPSEPS